MALDEFEYQLMQVLYSPDRIRLLADKVEELTGYPCYFCTVNWELMAKSKSVKDSDILKKSDLFKKTRESLTYNEYAKHKSKITNLLSQSPYLHSVNGKSYLFAEAFLYSNHVANVAMPQYSAEVEDFDPEKLEIILKVLSLCVVSTLGYNQQILYSNWEGILKHLLDGDITDISSLEHHIKNNQTLTAPGRFRILVFRSRGIDLRVLPGYEKLMEYFNRLQFFRVWIEYEGYFVLLVNDTARESKPPKLLEDTDFTQFLSSNNINVGYSEPATDLLKVPLLFYEAKMAENFSNRWNADTTISGYEECRLYDLLYNSTSPTGSLSFFITNRFRMIENHDRENGTQYMSILTKLIENRFNLTAASAELYIHKSTLCYHVKRMTELFNIDFNDSRQLLHLELSLFILQSFIH